MLGPVVVGGCDAGCLGGVVGRSLEVTVHDFGQGQPPEAPDALPWIGECQRMRRASIERLDSGVQFEAPEVLESSGELDVCQHCIVVATDKSSSFVGECEAAVDVKRMKVDFGHESRDLCL